MEIQKPLFWHQGLFLQPPNSCNSRIWLFSPSGFLFSVCYLRTSGA